MSSCSVCCFNLVLLIVGEKKNANSSNIARVFRWCRMRYFDINDVNFSKHSLTVSVNMNLGSSCVFTGLEDTYSFDSCLLRSERERDRARKRGGRTAIEIPHY